MEDIVVALIMGCIIYLYWTNKKPVKRKSTQDLFNYKKLYDDGLVELPGHQFRKVIQVFPIDISTRSINEQAAVWQSYRTMISSLTLPITIVIQSTHVDVNDYVENVNVKISEINNPFIREMGTDYLNYVNDMAENRKVRARKYYIICKIDLSKSDESGIDDEGTLATAINSLLRMANKQQKLSDEEAVMLARSELENIASVLRGYLQQIGIKTKVLDKVEVVNMGYETFNRDLATVIRTKEVNQMEAFSLFTKSMTSEYFSQQN